MINYIKLAIVGIVLGALVSYHFVALDNVRDKVNSDWQTKELKKDNERKDKEALILDEALKLEREKNEEINKLNATVNSLNYRLRNRPSRETIVYREAPGTEQACTGAQLYREDGEFLAGEAARADRVRIERDYYYNQYEQARKQLNESNKSH